MSNVYGLTKPEAEQIREFANAMLKGKAQTVGDFDRKEPPRTDTNFIADTVLGKAAEYMFLGLAREYGISTHVDMEVYPDPHVTDNGQDIPYIELTHKGYPGWFDNVLKVDIKATSHISKWLLVDKRKFISNVYILVRINAPSNWEKLELDIENLEGEISGYAYWTDILDQETQKPWFYFKRGDQLFHADKLDESSFSEPNDIKKHLVKFPPRYMNMSMRSSEVYGLPVTWLRTDWADFFSLLAKASV